MTSSHLTGSTIRRSLEAAGAGDEDLVALCVLLVDAVAALRAEVGLPPLEWPASPSEVPNVTVCLTRTAVHALIVKSRMAGAGAMPEHVKAFLLRLAEWRIANSRKAIDVDHGQLVDAIARALSSRPGRGHGNGGVEDDVVTGGADGPAAEVPGAPSFRIIQSRFAPDPLPASATVRTKRGGWRWLRRSRDVAATTRPDPLPLTRPSLLSCMNPNPITAAIRAGFARVARDQRPLLTSVELREAETDVGFVLPHEYVATMER